jgi:hypothetical protein
MTNIQIFLLTLVPVVGLLLLVVLSNRKLNNMNIQIKHNYSGIVLFEYDCENNTVAKTVTEAIKRSADLSYADLSYADLSSANLRSADLRSANLRSANLRSANLSYADLSYADLSSALNSEYSIAVTRIVSEGDIIGWKKCRDGIIVKLLIPKEAKRNNATGRKCRAEYAYVLEIFGSTTAISSHDSSVIYEVGKRMIPTEPFDDNFLNECSTGIHFFITRLEAENY